MADRKSKMISFRLSPEEYTQLHQACLCRGVRNVSELARAAMKSIISSNDDPIQQIVQLRTQLDNLSTQLDRLSELCEKP